MNKTTTVFLLCIVALASLVFLIITTSSYTRSTVGGEIFYFLVIPGIAWLFFFAVPRTRINASIVFLLFFVSCCAWKVYEINLAKRVSVQAKTLVNTIEEYKKLHGAYPLVLKDEFPISDPLKSRIGSYEATANHFNLFYYVLRRSICHSYDSTTGWAVGDD